MMVVARLIAFVGGMGLVLFTLLSAIRTLVLPRSERDLVTEVVFRFWRILFDLRLRWANTYQKSDRIMAFYAPLALLTLLPVWLFLVTVGFAAVFWATGIDSPFEAFTISGSSLLTLGFAKSESLFHTILEFVDATIGLLLIALVIAYLPTIYTAFSRRELAVTMLEVRAGAPPSAIEMILRYHRLGRLNELHNLWETWETWFAEIEENHTSLAALVFFRSPQPDHSWVTASGAILDAASLVRSTIAVPPDSQADLCIRAGYLALRRIAEFFRVPFNPDARFPDDPISITREEYEIACDRLAAAGVPLRADRDQAWIDFAGWRVNYDQVLIALCRLTMSPYAPWTSDRSLLETGPQYHPREA